MLNFRYNLVSLVEYIALARPFPLENGNFRWKTAIIFRVPFP